MSEPSSGGDEHPSDGRKSICGIAIAVMDTRRAADAIVAAARDRRRLEVHLCNAYTLSQVDGDSELRHALQRADLNLADGAPVAWLLGRHGKAGPVRGPELFREVVRRAAPHGLRHYLWGGAEGVAERAGVTLRAVEPRARIVGAVAPPFAPISDVDVHHVAAEVARTAADVVWVGLGTPKQDYLVPRLAQHIDRPIVPVGAAFDFVAGTVPEAPDLLHGTGAEWLYRLYREPKRLWRRYLVGNPRFILTVVKHAVRNHGT